MKTLTLLIAACTCALVACSHVAPQQGSAAAPASAPAAALHTYRCDNGETLVATYPPSDTATLRYQGTEHRLQIALSGSGARYVGSGLEWWTKGPTGTLSRLGPDGFGGERIAQCSEP